MRFGTLLGVCAIAATDAVQFTPGRLGFDVGGGDADDAELMALMERAAAEGNPEDVADIPDQAFLEQMNQLYLENPGERVHVDYLSPAEMKPVIEESHRAKAMSLYSGAADSAEDADEEDDLEEDDEEVLEAAGDSRAEDEERKEDREEEDEGEASDVEPEAAPAKREVKLTKTKRTKVAALAQEVGSDANLGEAATKVLSDTKADLVTVKNHMEALARQQSSLTHKMTARITRIIRDMNRTTETKDHSTSVGRADDHRASKSRADDHSAPDSATAWAAPNATESVTVRATEPLAVVAIGANGSRSHAAAQAGHGAGANGTAGKSNHSSAGAAAEQGAEKSNHSVDAATEQNTSKSNQSVDAVVEHKASKSNHSVDAVAEQKANKSNHSVVAVAEHNTGKSNHSVDVAAEHSAGKSNHSAGAVAEHSAGKSNHSVDAVVELNTSRSNHSVDAIAELNASRSSHAAVAELRGSGNITAKANQSAAVMLVKSASKPAVAGFSGSGNTTAKVNQSAVMPVQNTSAPAANGTGAV